MDNDTVAGDAEAAGAIAGMIETYGTKAPDDARVFTVYVNPVCTADGNQYTIQEYQFLGLLPGDLAALRFVHGGEPFGDIFFHHTRSAGQLYHSREGACAAVSAALQLKWRALHTQIMRLIEFSAAGFSQVEDIAGTD